MANKKWWTSKSIAVQVIGLVGTLLMGGGIIGQEQWVLYSGLATQVIGIIMRLVTKDPVGW